MFEFGDSASAATEPENAMNIPGRLSAGRIAFADPVFRRSNRTQRTWWSGGLPRPGWRGPNPMSVGMVKGLPAMS
jgi:hypothetical protein